MRGDQQAAIVGALTDAGRKNPLNPTDRAAYGRAAEVEELDAGILS